MNETKTVHHRNGTTTTFEHVRIPLPEVARRFAIWTRLLPVGWPDSDGVEYGIEREARGTSHVDGSTVYTTRLRVRVGEREAIATKTAQGENIGSNIETLDEDGATFWENEDKPNRWILADVFSV